MSSGEAVERYDRVRLKPGILPRYELAGMPLGTWLGDKMTRSWFGSNGCEYPKNENCRLSVWKGWVDQIHELPATD
jgi:hypothetical protein